jgi:hypothetical protein
MHSASLLLPVQLSLYILVSVKDQRTIIKLPLSGLSSNYLCHIVEPEDN